MRRIALLLAVVALAGCGGGGEEEIAAERYELRSREVERTLGQALLRPVGGERPRLVLLHARARGEPRGRHRR